MVEQEDNHFVAHPEGGVTTESQIAAEKAKAAEPQAEDKVEDTTEPTVEAEPADKPSTEDTSSPVVEPSPVDSTSPVEDSVVAEPADELNGKEPEAEPAE